MTNKIFDTNDPFIINSPYTGVNPVSSSVPYTSYNILQTSNINLSQIPQIVYNFEKNITNNSESSPLDLAIIRFGETNFYTSLKDYTEFLTINNLSGNINSSYPNLNQRISQGTPISPIEYASFVQNNLYTQDSIASDIKSDPTTVLKLTDDFYGKTFTESTMGGFCSLVPAIFGALDFFFNDIASISKLIDGIITGIKDFSLSGLLNSLKKSISSIIDSTIEKVKSIIDNFSVASVIGKIQTFANDKILGRALQLKEQAQSFFNTLNISNLKDKINGLISYASSLFKNPSINEIQYLIYRFCSFATEVENLLNSVTNPLNQFMNNYNTSYQSLVYASGINNVRAVSAGALRYNTTDRKSGIDVCTSAATAAGNPAPIEVADIDGVTSWNDGKGDSKVTFAGQWINILGEEGWTRVDPEVRVKIMRVQELMGRQLIILSGYRSPEYNAWLRSQGRHTAVNSQHMSGKACDVTFSGFNSSGMEELVSKALQVGFRGIGRYPGSAGNFVHMDIGPERHWVGT